MIQQSISAHASLFSYSGSRDTNPAPHQALELHNRLIKTWLYIQGLLTTEAPLVQWLLHCCAEADPSTLPWLQAWANRVLQYYILQNQWWFQEKESPEEKQPPLPGKNLGRC